MSSTTTTAAPVDATAMHSTSVREAMHSGIMACTPTASVHEAAQIMAGCDVDHLVVVDSRRDAPLGIISALDVARVLARGVADPRPPKGMTR